MKLTCNIATVQLQHYVIS